MKNRIRDGHGLLSNKQAMQLFVEHRPKFMSHLFLSHLSKNNNSPRIVQSLFDKIAGPTEIIIASRYRETRLYHIRNILDLTERSLKPPSQSPVQLSLFQLTMFKYN